MDWYGRRAVDNDYVIASYCDPSMTLTAKKIEPRRYCSLDRPAIPIDGLAFDRIFRTPTNRADMLDVMRSLCAVIEFTVVALRQNGRMGVTE